MDGGRLTPRAPVWTLKSLNWLLLVLCAVIVVVASFFLFYWNRLVGWFLAFILRVFFWKKYNAWVECEAFQVSLLAGRVLIKDFRYHSRNQSIRILKLNVTWRYWIWRTQTKEDVKNDDTGGEASQGSYKTMDLPCRISIVLEGLEFFFYNRTPAFDDILEQMGQPSQDGSFVIRPPQEKRTTDHPDIRPASPNGTAEGHDLFESSRFTDTSHNHDYPPIAIPSLGPVSRAVKKSMGWLQDRLPTFDLQELLPIGIEARKCAVILGNDSTPSIFIIDIQQAAGTYSATQCRSQYDHYKDLYSFKLTNLKIITRTNPDHQVPMVDRGKLIFAELSKISPDSMKEPSEYLVFGGFQRLVRDFASTLRMVTPTPPSKWQGLSRYKTEAQRREAGELAHDVEYAKITTLVETPLLEVIYHVDNPGEVPPDPRPIDESANEKVDIGNGDLSPEWAVELVMHGGSITYGPWADRQRDMIQKAFFPATYTNRTATQDLKPGDTRVHIFLKFLLELRGDVTIRLPVREASKDWKYQSVGLTTAKKKDKRPFGWLDIKVAASSTLSSLTPMVSNEKGYNNSLQVHLVRPVISSSVNGTEFWSSESCRILCDMPSPLAWNAGRTWLYDISFNSPVIYLLRDHVTLITDLINDWSSGPPSAFNTFVPTIYIIKFHLKQFKIKLYVGDHNVIDHPHSDDSNSLLEISGSTLQAHVNIPSNKFRPHSSTTVFWIEGSGLAAAFSLPTWNTHRTFAKQNPIPIGTAGLLRIDSSYQSFSETSHGLVDKFKLDVHVRQIKFTSYGWAIRHFLILKDNYFGGFTNFNTMNEYLDKKNKGLVGDPVEEKHRTRLSNVFEVSVNLFAQDITVTLPQEIYDWKNAVAASIPELQLNLRLHDYFMEMSLNIPPITIYDHKSLDIATSRRYTSIPSEGLLLIEGIDIVANRLFGPQPHTATYVCMWEIQVGSIRGILHPDLLHGLLASGRVFSINYEDLINAPAAEYVTSLDPDVTFLKLKLDSVDLTARVSKSAFHLACPLGISIHHNDLASKSYRSVTSICALVQLRSLMESDYQKGSWLEVASAAIDLEMDLYSTPPGWEQSAFLQSEFLKTQDTPTRRVAWMYNVATAQDIPRHVQGLFLPATRPPAFWETRRKSSPYDTIRRRGSFSQGSFFESDDEDISEGERLARVKSSRPDSPDLQSSRLSRMYTEGSLSSADESDDGGLSTSVPDSDSDTSEPASTQIPELENYRYVLDQYHLSTPGAFMHTAFVRFQQAPLIVNRQHDTQFPNTLSTNDLPNQPFIPGAANRVKHTATYRISLRNPAHLFVTPLFVSCLKQFLGCCEPNSRPLQQHLDELLSGYLSEIIKPVGGDSSVIMEVQFAGFRGVLVQDLGATNETENTSTPLFNRWNSGTVLSIASLNIDESYLLCVTSSMSNQENLARPAHLSLHCNGMNLTLHSTKSHPDVSASSNPAIVDLSIASSGATCTISPDANGAMQVGRFRGRFADSCPDLISKTLSSTIKTVSSASSLYIDYIRQCQQFHVHTIHTLLAHQKSHPTLADPLSWTHASFMVKLGVPRTIRTDLSWRMLAHARHCLSEMGQEEVEEIEQKGSSTLVLPSRDTMVETMARQQLGDWTMDTAEKVREMLLLNLLYPHKHTIQEKTTHSLSLSLNLDLITLEVYGKTEYDNSLVIGPSITNIRVGLRQLVPIGQNLSATALDPILHVAFKSSFQQVRLSILPTFIPFVRHIIQVHIGSRKPQSEKQRPITPLDTLQSPREILIEAILEVERVKLSASALNVIFDIALQRLVLVTTTNLKENMNGNLTAKTDEIMLRARGSRGVLPHRINDTLASLTISQVALHGAFAQETKVRKVRVALAIQRVQLSVPKSAIRLYRFVDASKKEYISTYETVLNDIFAEMEQDPATQASSRRPSNDRTISLDAHASIQQLGISLQVMRGTWLSWDIINTVAFANGIAAPKFNCLFGIQLASQIIKVTTRSTTDGSNTHRSQPLSIRLPLPSLKVGGNYAHDALQGQIVLGFFSIALKPQYVDDILAVQQKFGSDFNDLLDLFAENRKTKEHLPVDAEKRSTFPFKASVKLDGLRIALEGPSSTQYLESGTIEGSLMRQKSFNLNWSFAFSSLSLSLAHHSAPHGARYGFDRKYRSAYMILEISANNDEITLSNDTMEAHLNIQVHKIHAVMQAAAIGELGDLIDHVQAEMIIRKEQRATELDEIKKKTQRFITTLDLESSKSDPGPSWLDNKQVVISIESIGIAFPLTIEADIMLVPTPQVITGFPSSSGGAFLFSIQSMEFFAKRYEAGNAKIIDLSFRFVSHFDQSIPAHFEGKSHLTRNRMTFPLMTADVDSHTISGVRQFLANAAVSGFELDIDPSIANYVFSLIDVYRQGKERIEKLAPGHARANLESLSERVSSSQPPETSRPIPATTNIQADFTFQSGIIRFLSPDGSPYHAVHRSSFHDAMPSDSTNLSANEAASSSFVMEEFRLPVLTVRAEFQAASASEKLTSHAGKPATSTVVIKMVVHSSHNILRPTILPFFGELIRNIEARLRRIPTRPTPTPTPPYLALDKTNILASSELSSPSQLISSTLEITFTLRIDQSTLELTCQPDVNVNAGLHWQSGGFIVNIKPGANEMGVSGSIAGITAYVRHGYLQEDSLRAEARNLAFATTFTKVEKRSGKEVNSVSVVINTEIVGKMRFSRLQDVLCFKAVWLDRIPLPETRNQSTPADASVHEPVFNDIDTSNEPSGQAVALVFLAQVHNIDLEVDLGQSITKLLLRLESLVVRRNQSADSSDISLTVAKIQLQATRALSGILTLPDLDLRTLRRHRAKSRKQKSRQLEVSIRTGDLDASLAYDQVQLMKVHADSLHAKVLDDWTKGSSKSAPEHGIRLDFSVQGGEILAIGTLNAVPTAIRTSNKIQALIKAQREGAARESRAFRTTLQPKPSNPLSEVAAAVLQSARSKFKETEEFDVAIVQHMQFSVSKIQLQLYGQAGTSKLSHFEATTIDAQLERHVRAGDQAPKRDLHLSLGSFEVGSFDGKLVSRHDLDLKASRGQGSGYTKIFTVPKMEVNMHSLFHLGLQRLDYEFMSNFPEYVRTAAGQEVVQGLYLVLDFLEYEELIRVKKRLEKDILTAMLESKQGVPSIDTLKPAIPKEAGSTDTNTTLLPNLETSPGIDETRANPSISPTSSRRASTSSAGSLKRSASSLSKTITYRAVSSKVATPNFTQIGGTIDVSTFKKISGINVKEALPIWVHEYATIPIESIMKLLLEIYVRRLRRGGANALHSNSEGLEDSTDGGSSYKAETNDEDEGVKPEGSGLQIVKEGPDDPTS